MNEAEVDRVLFEMLMTLNQEAFDAGLYDVAYHILAAAVHFAAGKADQTGLAQARSVAEAQGEWIDVHAPAYHHSTANAHRRGITHSIFSMLAHQATLHRKMVEEDMRRVSH